MKREIKFRAWYDKSQSWVYFNLNEGFTHEGYKIYQELIISGVKFYQFTGLYEIYEGDIIRIEHAECVGISADGSEEEWIAIEGQVMFEDSMFVFEGHSAGTLPLSAYKDEIQVIGNIHQNPELL